MAGEVALEAADRFAGALAFGAAAGDVVAGAGWQRARVTMTRCSAALIWRLPPWSRRWRWVLPELAGIGATPAARASLAGVAKRWAPAISPTSLAAVSGPNPGSVSSCGAICGDELGDLALECLDRLGELADAPQLVAGDADAHRLLSPREPAGDARRPAAVEQRAAGQFELGPEVVQMPLQRAVEPDALTDQPFAVIDQQPQVELGPIQVRDRERLQALLQRGAGDGERVDRIGLAALTSALAAPSRTGASGSATPARRGRSETAPTTPRHAGSPQAPRPARHQGRAPTATAHRTRAGRPGRSARPATRRSPPRPRRSCANACECPRQARSLPSSSS